MSELSIELHWQRSEPGLLSGKYSNAHIGRYNDTCDLQVDAAPDWGGAPENTNPEQALAAALSSCHMMTFLDTGGQGQVAGRQLSGSHRHASW